MSDKNEPVSTIQDFLFDEIYTQKNKKGVTSPTDITRVISPSDITRVASPSDNSSSRAASLKPTDESEAKALSIRTHRRSLSLKKNNSDDDNQPNRHEENHSFEYMYMKDIDVKEDKTFEEYDNSVKKYVKELISHSKVSELDSLAVLNESDVKALSVRTHRRSFNLKKHTFIDRAPTVGEKDSLNEVKRKLSFRSDIDEVKSADHGYLSPKKNISDENFQSNYLTNSSGNKIILESKEDVEEIKAKAESDASVFNLNAEKEASEIKQNENNEAAAMKRKYEQDLNQAKLSADLDIEAIKFKAESEASAIKLNAEKEASEIKQAAINEAATIKSKNEQDLKEAKLSADRDIQEIKSKADAEASTITLNAEKEASEIKQAAIDEAATIKSKHEQDLNEAKLSADRDIQEIKAEARLNAEKEASEIKKQEAYQIKLNAENEASGENVSSIFLLKERKQHSIDDSLACEYNMENNIENNFREMYKIIFRKSFHESKHIDKIKRKLLKRKISGSESIECNVVCLDNQKSLLDSNNSVNLNDENFTNIDFKANNMYNTSIFCQIPSSSSFVNQSYYQYKSISEKNIETNFAQMFNIIFNDDKKSYDSKKDIKQLFEYNFPNQKIISNELSESSIGGSIYSNIEIKNSGSNQTIWSSDSMVFDRINIHDNKLELKKIEEEIQYFLESKNQKINDLVQELLNVKEEFSAEISQLELMLEKTQIELSLQKNLNKIQEKYFIDSTDYCISTLQIAKVPKDKVST